jgi:hypothetical protein
MAIAMAVRFGESELSYLISFYKSLSEKDRRRFAAIEAKRLGHGGMTYIAQVFGCSTKTISRGIDELDSLDQDPAAGRIRSPGAGRKKTSHPVRKSSKTYSH